MKYKNIFGRKKIDKRSPLKAPPLRTAGQSIGEEIHRLQTEEIGSYIFSGAFMLVLAAFEWYRWLKHIPPQPILITIVASIIILYCAIRILSYSKKVESLRLGRDGEQAVGEFLDRLRESGYRVFHDIVGGKFNIDHVLIGCSGIYTIETKTVNKYVKGIQKIQYDGESVSINGFVPDRNPISQAKAQAAWLKDLIKELTGRSLQVQPVVLYPGRIR